MCVLVGFAYVLLGLFTFFFFKQKTAYEMRISDWSSDVCSSDLIDLQRREAWAASGAVSGDELTVARNAHHTALAKGRAAEAAQAQARANRAAAIGSRDANKALIDNSTTDANPEVLAARAARDQARVDLERTILRAPIDGVISRRQVQIGQRVQPGQALMVVVPIQVAYVAPNFKEVKLAKVRPEQSVTPPT